MLLGGIDAIAQGAVASGVHLAAVCSGPVATELAGALVRAGLAACERAPSEKAAVELALGAALAGGRALAVLRVGGLEAASAALGAASCAGAAGLVVVACDDPDGGVAPASDSRLAARSCLVPVLEPSDPGECLRFVGEALALSERFETPVVLRLSTRLADSAEAVTLPAREPRAVRGQRREPPDRVVAPGGEADRTRAMERLALLAAHAWDTPLNRAELRSPEVGVVASGLAYAAVREALPEASVLKLGLVHPVPTGLVRDFAGKVGRLFVVEEQEPFLESELRAAGLAFEGRNRLTPAGGLTPDLLLRALAGQPGAGREPEPVPARPPELCPGCPHRALGQALKRLHVTVTSDRGCAPLMALSPLGAAHRAPGLGAAVAVQHGLEVVLGDRAAGRGVAVVGDGALLHSGVGPLAAAARGDGTVVVLDNGSHGGGTGREAAIPALGGWRVDFGALCRALGAAAVVEVDPQDLAATEGLLRRELRRPGLSVAVARAPCARLREHPRAPWRVDAARCNRCGACLRLGCPALGEAEGSAEIDAALCAGCGLCAQVCRARAIAPAATAAGACAPASAGEGPAT